MYLEIYILGLILDIIYSLAHYLFRYYQVLLDILG